MKRKIISLVVTLAIILSSMIFVVPTAAEDVVIEKWTKDDAAATLAGSGTAEEDLIEFSGVQLVQQISAEGNGAASAAGAACVDILGRVIEHKRSAIRQTPAQRNTFPSGQFQQHFLA